MRKNITVEFTNERIIPSGGLAVVGAILGKPSFDAVHEMDDDPDFYKAALGFTSPLSTIRRSARGVSRTYKGCDGYAPMFAYIGSEGYLANLELGEGKQHCQKGTPRFLEETIGLCRQLMDGPLLFRLDSGNDSAENIGILLERGCPFHHQAQPPQGKQRGLAQDGKSQFP